MYGFYGRFLKVDLTDRKHDIVTLPDTVLLKYLGGKGLASYLLYSMNPQGVDPLSPDNCLIFATGPITNSMIWGSSRYGVYTKSPQTGFYSESYSGGKVPEAIDSAGFDAIVVTGKSKSPAVIVIKPEGAGRRKPCSICPYRKRLLALCRKDRRGNCHGLKKSQGYSI